MKNLQCTNDYRQNSELLKESLAAALILIIIEEKVISVTHNLEYVNR